MSENVRNKVLSETHQHQAFYISPLYRLFRLNGPKTTFYMWYLSVKPLSAMGSNEPKCIWLTCIQQLVKTVTGNNKPHPFPNRSLDVAALGDDDGLDARVEALTDADVRHLQRRYNSSLERLQAGMRSGLDLILQNAPLSLIIERAEVGRLGRPNLLPPDVIWPAELLCQLGLDGGGAVGGHSVLLEDKIALRVGRIDPGDHVCVQEPS